jgi:hypothetical protein
MFGVPGNSAAISEHIDAALPDANVLRQLRDKLLPAGSKP